MKVAKTLPMLAFFLASFALEEENYSRLSTSDERPRAKKRRQDEPELFEQCRFVSAWKERLGHVSVLAFLDPSWRYSFRQAVLLELLSARLRRSGFPDIRFFVIASPSDLAEDELEDEIEIQTWKETSAYESIWENSAYANAGRLSRDEVSKMIVIQDDPQSRIWERFRASRDQVAVIDRCGKLTYQIMVPWSILYFPYVKAAVLSTYHEDPCGVCDPSVYEASDRKEYLPDGFDERINPRKSDDPIWTITERVHPNESLEEERETSTVSPIPIDGGIGRGTDHSNFWSDGPTESFFVESASITYDDATEQLSINENNTNQDGSVDPPRNSDEASNDGGNATTASFGLRQEESASRTRTSVDDDNASYGDARDRILLDEPINGETESDPIPNTAKKMIADADDEYRGRTRNEEDEDRIENLAEYGRRNDSAGEKGKNFNRPEGNVSNVRAKISPLSLRIIMHAPHIHKNGKKHRYLILKTGSPNYHGHFDLETGNTASATDSWQSYRRISSEERERDETKLGANEKHANQKYTFDTDESPGLYGEIADYWRSHEDSDIITDRNETSYDNYNDPTINYNEEQHDISDYDINLSKSSEANENYSAGKIMINTNTTDFINDTQDIVGSNETGNSSQVINVNDPINKEEETRNKLIEHYNKLLPWIYYILKK